MNSRPRDLHSRPATWPGPPPPTPTPCPASFAQVKVWDLRMLHPLHAYFSPSPAEWCDISQRGLLAVGHGRRVQVTLPGGCGLDSACPCAGGAMQ